jgi:hypothetical protein
MGESFQLLRAGVVMRRITDVVFVFLIIALASTVALSQEKRHIGKWQATIEKNNVGALQFGEDGSLVLYQNGKSLNKEMGDTVAVHYEIDYSHDPIWLDIVVTDMKGGEVMRGLALVKFVGEDEMWLKGNDNHPDRRPESFGEEKRTTTIRFRKVVEFNFDGFQ